MSSNSDPNKEKTPDEETARPLSPSHPDYVDPADAEAEKKTDETDGETAEGEEKKDEKKEKKPEREFTEEEIQAAIKELEGTFDDKERADGKLMMATLNEEGLKTPDGKPIDRVHMSCVTDQFFHQAKNAQQDIDDAIAYNARAARPNGTRKKSMEAARVKKIKKYIEATEADRAKYIDNIRNPKEKKAGEEKDPRSAAMIKPTRDPAMVAKAQKLAFDALMAHESNMTEEAKKKWDESKQNEEDFLMKEYWKQYSALMEAKFSNKVDNMVEAAKKVDEPVDGMA